MTSFRTAMVLIMAMIVLSTCAFAQTRPFVGPVTIISPTAATDPLTIVGASGQTGDLLQLKDSTGVVQSFIKSDGTIAAALAAADATPLQLLYTDTAGKISSVTSGQWDPSASTLVLDPNRMVLEHNVEVRGPFEVNNDAGNTTTFGFFPNIDSGVWAGSMVRTGAILSQKGTAANSNFWSHTIQTVIVTSNSPISYERAGLISWTATSDASDYTGPHANACTGVSCVRDAVGIDSRGQISGGIATGRAWGLNTTAAVDSGSDGLLVSAEFDLSNNGTYQPEVDQINSKSGITVVSFGTSGATLAIGMIATAGAEFAKGLYARQSSFQATAGSFIELDKTAAFTDLFRVKPSGQMLVGDLSNNANLVDYAAASYGIAAFRELISITDNRTNATANKNILSLFTDAGTSKHRIIAANYDAGTTPWPLTLETTVSGATTRQEVLLLTLDPFVQFTKSYAGGNLSAAGSTALRNNAGTLELSNNGGAWAAVNSGAVASPWTSSGTDVYLGTLTNNVEIGANAADDPTQQRLFVERDQNTGSKVTVRNGTSNTLAFAGFEARAGNSASNNDITMAVTSAGFSTASGIAANTGVLKTGADVSNGLILQTLAGGLTLQLGGTGTDFVIDTSGVITTGTWHGSVVTNTYGGTGTSSNIAANYIVYGGGVGVYTFSPSFIYDGTDQTLTGGSYVVGTDGKGVGRTSAYVTFTNATSVQTGVSGTDYFKVIASGTGTSDGDNTGILLYGANALKNVKIGAADSCGAGYRCLKIPN